MPREIGAERVAIYIRWSTEDQGEGTTLAVQSEACKHYLQSQGWTVREDLTFIDDGHSGGSLNRPALTALRAAVQQGLIDCVVVFKLDRLSRSVFDTVNLVLGEWEELTHLKSAREPIDTTTAMGKQFFYMLVSYAEWERSVIRERTFSGKIRRAREGRSPGMPAPFGYRKGRTPGSFEHALEEAQAVKLIFTLADQGASIRQITAHLNDYAVPTRRAATWRTSTVGKLLRNPFYAGELIWGRRRVNPRYGKTAGQPRLVSSAPHVCAQATSYAPLIERAQFERVQARLTARGLSAPAASGSIHLLTGILRCAICGGYMQYNAYGQWRYYRCGSRLQGGTCTAPSVPAEPVEREVSRAFVTRYGPAASDLASAVAGDQVRASRDRLQDQADSIRSALKRSQSEAARIDHDYRRGEVSAADRRKLLASMADERSSLDQRLRQTETDMAVTGLNVKLITPERSWDLMTPTERKDLLRQFIASAACGRSGTNLNLSLQWYNDEDRSTGERSDWPSPAAPA